MGGKNRLKAERAWFLSEGEESEAWNRATFASLGQKLRVFEPAGLSGRGDSSPSTLTSFFKLWITILEKLPWNDLKVDFFG